jgi:hypothetical protein
MDGSGPTDELPRRRRGARATLTLGTALGLAYLGYVVVARPGLFGLNYEVFHGAASAFLAGDPLYGVPFGRHAYLTYVYPPVTVVGFVPFALLPYPVAFTLHTALSVGCGLLAGRLLVRYLGQDTDLAPLDRALVYAFCAGSLLAMPSTVYGQVNLPLALLFVLGFTRLERGEGRVAGAAFGLAALVKLFPAGVGLWLLRRRAWRALAVSVLVGIGGLVAGLALGPELTVRWLTEAVFPRAGDDAFAGGLDPGAAYLTLQRPVSVLLPDAGAPVRTALSALVVAPVVAYVYAACDPTSETGRLAGAFVSVAGVLVVLPSYPIYYVLLYFPLVPMLYRFERRAYRWTVLGGLLLVAPLRLDDLRRLLGAVGVGTPPPLESLLTLVTPPLVGVGALFVACVLAVGQPRS